MRLPPAFSGKSGQIVHLNKMLFERMLNALLIKTVMEYDLGQCKTDPWVFRLIHAETLTLIAAVHVDHVFVVGAAHGIAQFHDALVKESPTNMVGEVSWYTGCASERNWKEGAVRTKPRSPWNFLSILNATHVPTKNKRCPRQSLSRAGSKGEG